ncbi:MAG: hypothetical protein EBV01_12850 [Betaproteobacteria bacterium]|nr:hypothetical protein [Betaproteobacteria bacterium]NBS40034.1 hypothetical protein [Betaproteobacteria bacterium]
MLRRLVLTLIFMLQIGCGGGSPSGSDSQGLAASNLPPRSSISTPSTTPTVGSTVQIDGTDSSDPEGSALSFRWSLNAPSGSAAQLLSITSSKTSFIPDITGVYTASLVVNDGAKDSAIASSIIVVGAIVSPAIQVDKAEPLSETVKLSLSGTVNGAVTWYADLRLIGSGNPTDGHSISWATSGVANGSHQILARIQTDANAYQDLQKTVTVSNSAISISALASGTTGTIFVDARAASVYGITNVSAKLDGRDLGVLTQPNACSQYCSGSNDLYRFTLDAATVGSGSHSVVITAYDANATSRSTTLSVPISNTPTVTVSSPSNGALAFGSLRISGTASSDKVGAVTTTIKLGDVQIHATQQSSFDTTFPLGGVTPGAYTLTVKSVDSIGLIAQVTRTVVVTSSAELAYAPVFTLPAGAQWLSSEGAKILYSLPEGGIILHDLQSSSQITLSSTSTLQYASNWQISGGRIYAQAKDSDCTITFNCVYEWLSNGVRRNLSTLSPFSSGSSYQENPLARDGFVIWTNWNGPSVGSYTLYDSSTQKFTKIVQPSSVNYLGNTNYDFSVASGIVDFWFWGQTGGNGAGSTFDIFNWRSDTATSTRITAGNARSIYPQVARARVAWQFSPAGGSADNSFTLMSQSGNSGTSQALGTYVTSFIAKDSVVAWISNLPGSGSLLTALTSTGTTRLSNAGSASLYANGAGIVIYGESGKVYAWSSDTAVKRLIFDTAPTKLLMTSGFIVIQFNSSVYLLRQGLL